MKAVRFDEGDPGRTGDISPSKFTGVIAALASILPLVGYFTDVLPVDLGLWDALGAFFVLAVIASGLWAGLGKGVFRKIGDALADRAR